MVNQEPDMSRSPMNIWRFIPRKFMAKQIHPLAVLFVAWRLRRSKAGIKPLWQIDCGLCCAFKPKP